MKSGLESEGIEVAEDMTISDAIAAWEKQRGKFVAATSKSNHAADVRLGISGPLSDAKARALRIRNSLDEDVDVLRALAAGQLASQVKPMKAGSRAKTEILCAA